MKKVKITLHGTLTYWGHRTFEIEVSDDQNVQLLDIDTINEMADEAKAVWSFVEEGYLQATDHTIDSVTEAEESPLSNADEGSPATLDINDPRIARICSLFGIDPNQHDSRLGDEPPVSV